MKQKENISRQNISTPRKEGEYAPAAGYYPPHHDPEHRAYDQKSETYPTEKWQSPTLNSVEPSSRESRTPLENNSNNTGKDSYAKRK